MNRETDKLPPGKFLMLFVNCYFFQNQLFLKNLFRYTILVSNRLDRDQTCHFAEPDLGPNCLQKLSADDTGR